MSSLDLITVGEAMALLVAQQPGALSEVEHFRRLSAGAELNVAIGLARLGLRVAYVSRVGHDPFGDYLLHTLDSEGIDRRYVQVDALHPTGFMLKSCETDGADPQIAYYRRGSAASHLSVADWPDSLGSLADRWRGARRLHITGISLALSDSARDLVHTMVAQARSAGVAVSLDPNLRPRLWSSQQLMVDSINQLSLQADLVMPGITEGTLLTGCAQPHDIASWYLDQGVRQVVIKLGARGAYVADHTTRAMVPGFEVARVVDTVGAGDGFAAGVLSALLDGHTLEQAAIRGNAVGARVVQFVGDSEGLPDRDQLEHCMQAPRRANL